MINVPGFSSNTPPNSPGPRDSGSPSKNEQSDKIKRTFSNEFPHQSSNLSPEKQSKLPSHPAKRLKKNVDIEKAALSKQWDVLLVYFKDNPGKIFKYADLIKSQLASGNMSFSEFLPIVCAAAENLKQMKKPIFDPFSIETTSPNSLFRLFGHEIAACLHSYDSPGLIPYFSTLVKQDKISKDPFVDNETFPTNLLKQMVLIQSTLRGSVLYDPETLEAILPALLKRLTHEEFVNVMTRSDGTDHTPFDLITPKMIESLTHSEQLMLGNALAHRNHSLKSNLPSIVRDYVAILEKTEPLNPNISASITALMDLSQSRDDAFILIASFVERSEIPLQYLRDFLTDDDFLNLGAHLRHVNLNHFKDISFGRQLLRACPNLHTLIVNNSKILEGVDELPSCINLTCVDCEDTLVLPIIKNCESLCLINCADIESLPGLPRCNSIFLKDCPNLRALPDKLPFCQVFECLNSPLLVQLPDELPLCESFILKSCPLVQRLPALNNSYVVKIFDCNGFEQFSGELPVCENLRIANCPRLAKIPEVPFCIRFKVENCANLTELPSQLPHCEYLELVNLPLLVNLPQLNQFTVSVIRLRPGESESESSEMEYYRINFDDLSKRPLKSLKDLAEHLEETHSFPIIQYMENDIVNDVFDAGGVSRDLVTRLSENLFKTDPKNADPDNFFQIRDGIPLATDRNEIEVDYIALGTLLAYCCGSNSTLKTGPLFDVRVYECLFEPGAPTFGGDVPTDDWLSINYARLAAPGLDLEKVKRLIDLTQELPEFSQKELDSLSILAESDSCPSISSQKVLEDTNNRALVRKAILENARLENSVKAITRIAEGLMDELAELTLLDDESLFDDVEWAELVDEGALAIKERIEGVLDVETLKSRIQYEPIGDVDPDKYNETVNYLNTWINQNNDLERLELFVRALTGNKTLSFMKLHIKILHKVNHAVPPPTAATCNSTLYLPADYESQAQFNQRLEIFLTEGMAGTGFSLI